MASAGSSTAGLPGNPQPLSLAHTLTMSIIALLGLYGAGLLTFASPCVLPLFPVYLALLGGAATAGGDAPSRLRRAGIGFALGLSLVFVLLGMGASAAAHALSDHRRTLQVVAGVAMGVFGLFLLGVIRSRALDRDARPLLEKIPTPGGLAGGFLFGAAFAVGWTPCVGPVLAAALTYAAGSSASAWVAGGKLAVYAAGLSTPLVAAAFAAPRVLAFTKRLRNATPRLQKVMGVSLIALGALMALDRTSALTPRAGDGNATAAAPCAPSATACAPPIGSAPSATEGIVGKPRVVEFVSSNCTVCARMNQIVEQVSERCGSGDSLLRVSVDDDTGKALASRYSVRVVPTFITVDATGAEVERLIGEQTGARIARAVEEARGEACVL